MITRKEIVAKYKIAAKKVKQLESKKYEYKTNRACEPFGLVQNMNIDDVVRAGASIHDGGANITAKIELKPFDKVLVRDGKDEIWEPAFFFRNLPKHNVYKYQTVGGKLRVYCIPFNKETAKLIGTSNDWEG